jgi:hypothetical protein
MDHKPAPAGYRADFRQVPQRQQGGAGAIAQSSTKADRQPSHYDRKVPASGAAPGPTEVTKLSRARREAAVSRMMARECQSCG